MIHHICAKNLLVKLWSLLHLHIKEVYSSTFYQNQKFVIHNLLTRLEKATESIVVMLAESVILPLILTVILTQIIGVYGVFLAPSVGGVISVTISFIIWRKCVKEELKNN